MQCELAAGVRSLSAVCIVLHMASHARTTFQCAHMIVMLAESSMPAACQPLKPLMHAEGTLAPQWLLHSDCPLCARACAYNACVIHVQIL